MVRGINPRRLPGHVAVVMDGNGRWAKQRRLARTEGHAAGEDALFDTVDGAIDLGLGWLTVFAFSTENWRRPLDEVRFLMGFNEGILVRHRDDLDERDVRMRFVGRRGGRVPKRVLARMEETEELTRHNKGMTLTIAFNYGGRAELVDAAQAVARAAQAGELDPDRLDEKKLARLLIRTSGEHRISNFLLWQLAYAELLFTDVLWPDFRRENLFDAIRDYQRRERRFGAIDKS